ncbi:MAG: epoxyqueuosine reductase QueH [Thermodesulfovibrionales bacterium]
MKLLLHICCANCALYPVARLDSLGVDFVGLWYNPNIHPEEEYESRLGAVRELQDLWGLRVEYSGGYGLGRFNDALRGRRGLRCEACYEIRLEEAASTARKMGLDGFTTTLLVSPHQRFGLVVDTGERMGRKYSIPFFAEDFRPGWREAAQVSRGLGLYRQKYCGCHYSRAERAEAMASKGRRREAGPLCVKRSDA